ncbi:MAG: SlyX protein [Pseudomonadales bacterium]|nr:SlyX protein [Pseudomonadales bacterium]
MDNKLVDLETKFSFQEDLLQDLNDVVVKQQKEIERLGIEMKHLQEQILDLADSQSGPADSVGVDEKPPHY